MASIPLTPADVRVPGQVGFIQRSDSNCLTLAHESIKWAKNEAKKEIDAKKQRPKDKEQEDRVTGDGITFFTLNQDIRNIIYEYLFEGGMIDFWTHKGFQRSGQMLRVSKAIYDETRPILYQQNFFRFCYDHTKVGKFYEKAEEIGYAGGVEFLRMIGRNVCDIRFVQLWFSPSYFPGNEKDVLDMLGLLRQANLCTVSLRFFGGTPLSDSHSEYVEALTKLKTDHLEIADGLLPRGPLITYKHIKKHISARLRREMVRDGWQLYNGLCRFRNG